MRFPVLPLLLLAACPPRTDPPIEAPPLPPSTRDNAGDPLREPPELHLAHVRQLSFGGRAGAPLFAEGGTALSFLWWAPEGGAPRARLFDVATGKERPLPPFAAGRVAADLWLSAEGVLCADMRGTCPAGAPCPVEAAVPLQAGGSCPEPPRFPLARAGGCATTRAGDWACPLLAASGPELWLWPAQAASPAKLGPMAAGDPSASFSPDGRSVIWARPLPQWGPQATVLTRHELAGPSTDLGPLGQRDLHPAWFPDGHLLFASNADDAAGRDLDIFRLDAEGEDLERVTFSPEADTLPAVAPDGKTIAWVSARNAAAAGELDVLVAEWVE